MKTTQRSRRDALLAGVVALSMLAITKSIANAGGSPFEHYGSNPNRNLIRSVQQALVGKGFNPGPVDGWMGNRTGRALAEFQRANNLPVSGRVDDATIQALGLNVGR